MRVDIENLINNFPKTIEREIKKSFKEKINIPNLTDSVEYCFGTKGKRIRPLMCIETCRRLGGDIKKAMPLAVAAELMHNWLLIHDDIEDGDIARRGQPTLWVKYGVAHGINIGDYIQNKVYQIIADMEKIGINTKTIVQLMRLTAMTLVATTEGQAMDINLRQNDAPTEKQYFDSVQYKTGQYLVFPMLAGAIVAGVDKKIIKLISDFGKLIGPAFQISNDLIDLKIGKGCNDAGNDIREGKRTLIAIYALEKCSVFEKRNILEILNKKREMTTDKEVAWSINLFEKTGGIKRAEQKAVRLTGSAIKIAKKFPAELREFAVALAAFVATRNR